MSNTHLSVSRIRTIMKSSADVDVVGKDSIFVVARAAELFIQKLASEACNDAEPLKDIQYDNVANVVNNDVRYEFLREIIPKKITVAEYFKILKEQRLDGNHVNLISSSSSESSSSGSEDDKSDEEVESSSDVQSVHSNASSDVMIVE